MNASTPSAEEFRQILRTEVGKISSPRQIAFLDSIIIEPYRTCLSWEYGNDEESVAWVFADMREPELLLSTAVADTEDAAHLGASIFGRPNTSARIAGIRA